MGNRIKNRGGLPLLDKYKIHPECFLVVPCLLHVFLVPTFGVAAWPWSVSRSHCPWSLPRKGYKNPKKYDGPLDTGNQHSDAFELFVSSFFCTYRHVYDASVSDRIATRVICCGEVHDSAMIKLWIGSISVSKLNPGWFPRMGQKIWLNLSSKAGCIIQSLHMGSEGQSWGKLWKVLSIL